MKLLNRIQPTARRRHRRVPRVIGAASVVCLGLALVLVPAPAGAAGATTYVIGVGAAPPAGSNLEYVDFFPSSGINVHNGDVIDFNMPAGESSDDSHIPALLPQGQTVAQAFANPANALVIPDSDESGSLPLQNINVFGPTFPPAGSGAPGQCGDQTTPCVYNGSALLNGGGGFPGADFFVKIGMSSGFTGSILAVDLAHPVSDPSATISVVADSAQASTQSALASAAASQYQTDTSGIQAASASASTDKVTTNANGTHNHSVSVGASTSHAEAMQMLPSTVNVSRGDTVTWNYGGASEPHTVQFPGGGLSNAVSPFAPDAQCEGPSGDTVAVNNQGPPNFGCASPAAAEQPLAVQAQGNPVISSPAYRTVAAGGGIFDFGQAAFHGSAASQHLNSPVVDMVTTGDEGGYYETTANGGVYTYGDARFFGSMAGKHITAPIVALVTGPVSNGYVLVGSDGNTYSFGAAPQLGKVISHLNKPLVGSVYDPSNNGPGAYGVASDGGVFAVLSAVFHGSMGGKHLNAPIVGMAVTPDGGGYWLVASDGGIFSFGDAAFHGSMGNKHLNSPIVGITTTPTGNGYWLVGRDGGIFSFGDASFHGSTGNVHLNSPVVGISSAYSVASSGVLINIPPGNPNDLPSRTSYTFTFPDSGSYSFICGFHEMMTGTVVVH